MAAYTKTEAQTELAVWKAALSAIAGGQEYSMPDGRTMKKADLAQVLKMVDYFGNLVSTLTRGTMRTYNVIPLDC